ncbi:MAG: hypothetical protein LH467_02310 [Gemmatimonadaceae bacterium]|nr:hypothetical protein [Gemmatimonadaceae bacterium]
MLVTALALIVTILACRDITSPTGGRDPGSSSHLLNPSGSVVVSPADMHGWAFYNDQNGTLCADSAVCRLVEGPGGPPSGVGSAELATTVASDGLALIRKDYAGTRFDAITTLEYSTYRQSVDSGNNLAIAFQVNADYDLNDAVTGWQGRLVFEPYQGNGGNAVQGIWQRWDAKAGKWWGTKASVPKAGIIAANPCVQATPCTWTQLLAAYPNVGVHGTYGAVILKAGSGWPSFRGNVDLLTIGTAIGSTSFDFELTSMVAVPSVPPDSLPSDYSDTTKAVSGGRFVAGMILPDILVLGFKRNTPQADRQSAIALVKGVVVGGRKRPDGDGLYLVRVPVNGTLDSLFQAIQRLRQLPQVSTVTPEVIFTDLPTYLRPNDGVFRQR